MDIEKAFNFLDHNFLISTLEKYGFGRNLISWVKISLKKIKNLNGTTNTKYFLLGRSTRQGNPISPDLFIYFSLKDLISSHKIKTRN